MGDNEVGRPPVAVIGFGTIGRSWADAFLDAGYDVRAWDPQPNIALLSAIQTRSRGRFTLCDEIGEAIRNVIFVQESGPETLAVKIDLFKSMAATLPPEAIVASSSSTLMPSDLQEDCPFSDRILIGHPFNPPHILPLVEVVGGRLTSAAAIEAAMAFYRRIGKYPINLRRERPGHLANRLQAAVWREAIDAVACGQASVAEIDAAITLALGPRWALMGPFATFDMGGGEGGLQHFLDHLGAAFERLWDDAERPVVDDALKHQLVSQTTAMRHGRSIADLMTWRDRALTEVLTIAEDHHEF